MGILGGPSRPTVAPVLGATSSYHLAGRRRLVGPSGPLGMLVDVTLKGSCGKESACRVDEGRHDWSLAFSARSPCLVKRPAFFPTGDAWRWRRNLAGHRIHLRHELVQLGTVLTQVSFRLELHLVIEAVGAALCFLLCR